MTAKVHGGVRGGEFLTGKMDFFTIKTLVPVAQTNVVTPSADLYQISSTVWTPVTVVDGAGVAQTYNSKAAYDTAWEKQANLDTFLKVFAIRANAVAVSVSVATVADPSADGFGSSFTTSASVATINIATEKSGLWYAAGQGNYGVAADDTNNLGYLLADALNDIVMYDATVDTDGAATKNTLVDRRTML